MAIGVLRASLFCVLATLVWAGNDNPPSSSSNSSAPAVGSNVACEDTDGKRPACTGTCPVSCPQQCLVSCPGCRTFCRPDQVRVRSTKQPVRPPAMFIFGDGNLDVGNIKMVAMGSWERPDDETLIDWVQSRTDGDNAAQFIAKFMGFQMSPPAYLTLPNRIRVHQGFIGVNYACANAGLRDPEPDIDGWPTIPMSQQLQQFAETKAQMEAKLGAQAVRNTITKSFFLIEVGGVDLAYWTEVQDILALYGDTIRSMYNMGARRFGLINVGLIGNMPPAVDGAHGWMYQGVGGKLDPADMNKHAVEFNDGLKPLLGGLAKTLPGLRYSIADMYTFTQTVFADPSAYGFEDIHNPCIQDDIGFKCDNPAQRWYWDDNGITQHAANLAATAFFYGPPQFTAPVIFRSLLDVK
ncbi:hypothetical protein QYE76_055229 [Lolium multiflorum]|uniref:Uncharacterized protein n=1 Tax=Lolium multiflorum TaxID=4521 RepID=A0AAD8T083_LOLMU|nr:hypothetical protein QYE76_055229 [Lolium multiflorum]